MSRILVIDDDAIIRLMATEALQEAGYDVTAAANAEEGLRCFEHDAADLVLLDVILPGIDGFTACSQLRALPAGATVPIIVMTGLDDRRSIVEAYNSGATDFITKPIVWDLLPYRVRYALRAHASLQETQRGRTLLARSQSIAQMGSWEWQRAGDALQCSDEMLRIHGHAPGGAALRSNALLEAVHAEDRATVEKAFAGARDNGRAYAIEFRIERPDGTLRRLFEQTDVEHAVDGSVLAVRGIRRDITQQAEASERIRTLAYFDGLTGLANRALFREMLQQWLPHAERHDMRCAVLVIDLDRFKLINETLGTRLGDEVLKTIGERLRECLRGSDPKGATRGQAGEDLLARLGGDEFTVLLVDVSDDQANGVAQRIAAALVAPIVVNGNDLAINASIGIAMTPNDGSDIDALLGNAGTAMHAAKQDTQRIRFYDDAMGAQIARVLTIENELRRAIEQGDLRLHYQAKVDTRDSAIVGAEALLRWLHPQRGLVSPAEFIPIAEESGLIVPITRWVIGEACRQLAAWRREGVTTVPVSINLDGISLQGEGLVACAEHALAINALPPAAIEFEVTESSLMRDLSKAGRVLQQLRQLGVKLSIDDFGTGYSSLTYLKRFPVDALKIDRSFVQDLESNASDAALTAAVIAMGASLNLQLIAEGVETWGQAHFLAERGCHLVQGFLFARPAPPEAFAGMLRAGLPIAERV